jgi:hypothetical protein
MLTLLQNLKELEETCMREQWFGQGETWQAYLEQKRGLIRTLLERSSVQQGENMARDNSGFNVQIKTALQEILQLHEQVLQRAREHSLELQSQLLQVQQAMRFIKQLIPANVAPQRLDMEG